MFILLRADAVAEGVELSGLPPVSYEDRLRLTAATGNQIEDIVMERYQLFFGDCRPSQSMTAKFELVNPTPNWLRFEWAKLPAAVEITPKSGHVRPQSFVALQAEYAVPEECQIHVLPAQCTLWNISVPESYDMEHVWNSEHQSLQISTDVRKVQPNADSLSSPRSADKMDNDRNSDHSVKDGGGKHDKKDNKKVVELKKSKEKKQSPIGI